MADADSGKMLEIMKVAKQTFKRVERPRELQKDLRLQMEVAHGQEAMVAKLNRTNVGCIAMEWVGMGWNGSRKVKSIWEGKKFF